MTLKNCSTCGEVKPTSEFHRLSRSKTYLQSRCKKCDLAANTAYRRTKNGLVSCIYGRQKYSSKRRTYHPPDYNLIELRKWMFNNPDFDRLFNDWVDSGYDKNKAPSPDRLNDYLPYSLNNLRLVTWKENNEKHYSDMRKGINNKLSKRVHQLTMDGNVVNTYPSICFASRATNGNAGNIGTCCNGNRKNAGGFKWEFA